MEITKSFRSVFEPRITALAPRFADRSMMITKEGEIRCYGVNAFQHEDGTHEYHYIVKKSRDYGMSFFDEEVSADDPAARVCSPWSGDYITLLNLHFGEANDDNHCHGTHFSACIQDSSKKDNPQELSDKDGIYVFRSTQGPDGPFTMKKVIDKGYFLQRLPIPLKKRKRWICSGSLRINHIDHPVVLISDDDGETWRDHVLPPTPCMDKIVYPHKGYRWIQCGCEPIIAETRTGRLIMLLRTSTDVHYQCFSEDGGDTWSEMVPSPFFADGTMPGLYTLSDGRILAIWNNTTPLPELDHYKDKTLPESVQDGTWEDVFTNRDALHAAISEDDGNTWIGFREIALNAVRNDPGFRTCGGGSWFLNDKSVHQNQVIELPENKVLVHYGQHVSSSRIMIFDLNFLYAKSRQDHFISGLDNWSTQLYVKSPLGGWSGPGSGHCSYNRRSGAQLIRSPEGNWHEALLIGRHQDSRLVNTREGAVWNFPAVKSGEITLDLTVPKNSQGLRISLCDRWINPCDDFVKEEAVFSFVLNGDCSIFGQQLAKNGKRFTLKLSFDLEKAQVIVTADEDNNFNIVLPVTQTLKAPFGDAMQLSYLHLQSFAEDIDEIGTYLHEVKMQGK